MAAMVDAAVGVRAVSEIVAAVKGDASAAPLEPLSAAHEDLVRQVARNGAVPGDWTMVRRIFALKMVQVLQEYYSKRGFAGLKEHTFELRCEALLLLLDRFEDPPFTIQRFAEVLADASPYQSTHKLMNCFEKLLSVTTTV
jgi:hypothetical protein